MSEIKVNKISPKQTCTTVTLGDSGDTFIIPSGVTMTNNGTATGFGATYNGAVNWDTTAKTGNFTAVSGNGYFVNTTSGAITVTMPAAPSAGDIVALSDYASTWSTNNVNLSSAIYNGSTGTPALSTNNQTVTLIYVDGTQGWITTDESTTRLAGFVGITATGGTITTCGDYKIHTFTGPGTFCVSTAAACSSYNVVSYMVVAGGGGGGAYTGGGGGAGGFREYKSSVDCYTASPLNGNPGGTAVTVTATAYPITVGGGGAGYPTGDPGGAGSAGANSIFSTITSAGGGGGGGANLNNGSNGGSGGGGSENIGGYNGNTPPVTPPQGSAGGTGSFGPNNDSYEEGGAGGGATANGGCGTHNGPSTANGGAGATTSISGSPTSYAGGGGGGKGALSSGGSQPQGGTGGGGNGSFGATANTAGGTNTGGGGGGGSSNPGPQNPGKAGGSGIVIIRYKYQ